MFSHVELFIKITKTS